MNTGHLFSVEKSDGVKDDFEVYVCGDFDFLPEWWGRALECAWSWWDGGTGDDSGNQVGYRLRQDMTAEQCASVKRLLRRAARVSNRGIMPALDESILARCNRAFAA